MKPVNNYIMIKLKKADTVTKSGIILPTEEGKKMEIAEVAAVAKGVTLAKKNDKVCFKSYSLDSIVIDEIEYNFIKADDILAVW